MALSRGRPKPIEERRRLGNPGKRPLPKGLTLIAPATLELAEPIADGRALVEALLESPAGAWIAQPDRLALLELVAAGWDERARLLRAIDDLPAGWEHGRYTPAVFIRLDRVERNLTQWLSLLGLTPVDRTRIGVAEVRARTKLEALRERRAARSRAG